MSAKVDISGQRFGMLTAIHGRIDLGRRIWECLCDCGRTVSRNRDSLVKIASVGFTSSCGCSPNRLIGGRKNKTHGLSQGNERALYGIHRQMLQRCYNPKQRCFKDYGGRGINVCAEWHEVEKFFAWAIPAGYEPGLSIDRQQNDGNYEPGNCRWIPKPMQQRNTRQSRWLTINGERKVLIEWAEYAGITEAALRQRIDAGWDISQWLIPPCPDRGRFGSKETA